MQNSFAETYVSIADSRHLLVFPFVAKLLERCGATCVLDYGGGDGRFLASLPAGVEGFHFDRSGEMRALAVANLSGRSGRAVLSDCSRLRPASLDAVTMIAVWMELASEAAVAETLGMLRSWLKPGGHLIAAVTHPCFREERFSTYKAHFSNTHYFDSGRRFAVEVFDRDAAVTFEDYHWNLQDMSRQLRSAGFAISDVYEKPDVRSEKPARGAAWLIIDAVTA